MWHPVAPDLAAAHTIVAADLRGYGGSTSPARTREGDHAAFSKRAMALDQVALMSILGFDAFSVVGHDRGGRVAYRMALDHPGRVTRLAVLDIVPTADMWRFAEGAREGASASLTGTGISSRSRAASRADHRRRPGRVLLRRRHLPLRRRGARRLSERGRDRARCTRCARTTAPAPRSTTTSTRPTAPPAGASSARSSPYGRRATNSRPGSTCCRPGAAGRTMSADGHRRRPFPGRGGAGRGRSSVAWVPRRLLSSTAADGRAVAWPAGCPR